MSIFLIEGQLFIDNIYNELIPDDYKLYICYFDVIFNSIINKKYVIECINPNIWIKGYIINPLREIKMYKITFDKISMTFNNTNIKHVITNANYINNILSEINESISFDEIIDKNEILIIICDYLNSRNDVKSTKINIQKLKTLRNIKYTIEF